MKRIILILFFILFAVSCTTESRVPVVKEAEITFDLENFHADVHYEDKQVSQKTYTKKDFERLAYFTAVAWKISGYEDQFSNQRLMPMNKCLSNFEVFIKEKLHADRLGSAFAGGERSYFDPQKPNFMIAFKSTVYEQRRLVTFVHEFMHIAGGCGIDDFDSDHDNSLLWYRFAEPMNPMALIIALEANYLDSQGENYFLTKDNIDLIRQAIIRKNEVKE